MPDVSQQFNGQQLILPGAYAFTNISATANTAAANVPPVIFIGYGYGTKPLTPITFANQQDMVNALRGGPASLYLEPLFNPSDAINGAALVTWINAAPSSTQSSLVLSDATPAPVLTLTSKDYGLPSNQLQTTVTAGSIGGVEIYLFDGFSGKAIVKDNLGIPLQIAYLGAGTVTYTVTATALTITSTVAAENAVINFGPGGYKTVADAVNYLNGTGFYLAYSVSNPGMPLTSLDLASAVSLPVPTAGVPNYVSVTAFLGDIVYWSTQFASDFILPAVVSAGIVSGSATKPVAIPATHFSGATSVPPTAANYASALNVALGVPGWVVFIDSNLTAVQALGAQHVETASSITYRRPRRFVTGSSPGDSVATTQSAAISLNSKQTTYCYPGIYVTDLNTGNNVLQGGLYWAAAAAGAYAGNEVALPLTNKVLTGNGVEAPLTLSQINQLQNSGVMVLYVPDDTGVPTIASDMTTWQTDNNPSNLFNQQVAIDQYVTYVLQQTGQRYVGTIASPFDLTRMKNAFKTVLNQMVRVGSGQGVLASWDPTSLAINYTSTTQTSAVTVNVVPVGQNRFITITAYVQPLNISV